MRNKKKRLVVSLVLFVLAAFLGGVAAGLASHDRIASFAYQLRYVRHVTLEHGNILTDGLDGFLRDLDDKLDLPEDLYATAPSIAFDGDGEIKRFWISLYGEDSDGRGRNYTVSYDRSASEKMEVHLGESFGANYEEQDQLSILLRMAEAMDLEGLLVPGRDYTLAYNGVTSFYVTRNGTPDTSYPYTIYTSVEYLPGDADGDGVQSGETSLEGLPGEGHVEGYVASLEGNGEVRAYIMEPVYTSYGPTEEVQETMERERKEDQARQIEAAKATESWLTDGYDGTMYFFLDGETGWRLAQTDAALGSRSYALEMTRNGGISWEQVNDDPFDGNIGVAEGLIFYDEDYGYAGLAGASQDRSRIYVTRDGGRTFAPVELPMDMVTELPEQGQKFDFSIDDYDYYMMPENSGNILEIIVVTQNGEKDGLVFQSDNFGVSWSIAP